MPISPGFFILLAIEISDFSLSEIVDCCRSETESADGLYG